MKLPLKKLKLAALFGASVFFGFTSFHAEAMFFRFTAAPTDALVTLSADYLAKRFEPTGEESKFIRIAKISPRP